MNTNIKAVFFDIGGTLVEKTKNKQRNITSLTEMIRLLELDCSVEEFLAMVSRGEARYKEWRDQTLQELPVAEKWAKFLLAELDHEFVMERGERLQQLWGASRGSKHVRAYAPLVLREIKSRGYLLGTISHSSPRYLDEPGLADLFEVKVHAPQFGMRKPHPSLFVDAARQCGLSPRQCAYVGDNSWRDVVGPREAGYEMVIFLRNGSGDPAPGAEMMQPDLVISDLRELLDYLPQRVGKETPPPNAEQPDLLYDVALSTMWWNKETLSAEEFFSCGRRIGFARFELNHQVPPAVFEQIDINRFSIGSLHDPCPALIPAKKLEQTDVQITSRDEDLRRKGVDVVKYTIDQASRMHARLVVVHPGRITGDHSLDDQLRALYREGKKGSLEYSKLKESVITNRTARAGVHLEQCLESLREIVSFAEGSGVMIGLENRFHYYELPVYNEMERILDEFQQPWLGWQFDMGHLQVHHQLGLTSFIAWLERFGRRIVGVHIHDVIGIKDHQAPGCGEVDFDLVARYLPSACYRTVEVDPSVSDIELVKGLKLLAGSGCINEI